MLGAPRVLRWRHDDEAGGRPAEDMLALERQVCFALSVAARNVVAVYRPVLEPLGLTHPQYLVMLALWQHGPLSVKDLSGLLQLDPGTLSPLLKRLEAAGLLRRERDAEGSAQPGPGADRQGQGAARAGGADPRRHRGAARDADRGTDVAAGGADPGDRRLPAGAGRLVRRSGRRAG